MPLGSISNAADVPQQNYLATRSVLDTGVTAQTRAGRVLTAADFTTLLGLSTPVGLFNLSDLTNLGSGGALSNKGTVTFAKGVSGAASEAAQFSGATTQALYVADTGASDPFRLKTGSWGLWFRTAKRGTGQSLITKYNAAGTDRGWYTVIGSANTISAEVQSAATTTVGSITGVTDVCDDRWHFAVFTYDGSVHRMYVDGALEASNTASVAMYTGAGPLNIGGYGGDASTATGNPFYGRVDEAFVTTDVLTEEQIRILMSVRLAHGLSVTPRDIHVGLRRRKKGGPLVTGDFTATPKVIVNGDTYSTTTFASLGSTAPTITNNGATKTPQVAGPDGKDAGGFQFNGTDQYLSASDSGLPSGTASRTYGCWFKTTSAGSVNVMAWGTVSTNDARLLVNSGGLSAYTGAVGVGPAGSVNDGAWHFAVAVEENAPADGLKQKLYIDGKLVASGTALTSLTLSGLKIGTNSAASGGFFPGSIARAFITDYAMAQDEISSLFAKGSLALGLTAYDDDREMTQIVQGFDATNLYVLGDVRKRVSGRVNSDGTISEAVGGDFRVVKSSTGTYNIYWPIGFFTSPPVLTLGLQEVNAEILFGENGNTSTVTTASFRSAANTPADKTFYFTAEGRGPVPSQHQLDLGVQS